MKDHPLFVSRGFGLLLSTVLVAGCASHTATVLKPPAADSATVETSIARTSIGFDEPAEEQLESPKVIVQTGAETVDEKFADGVRSKLVI